MPPAVSEQFDWAAAPWGSLLRARALRHVPHGWTTRELALGNGTGADATGWEAVASAAGLSPANLVRLRQVHGAHVHHADGPSATDHPEADVVLTGRPDRVVAVQVADCAAVLVADADGRVVAAAHAGWRGTAADAAGEAVRAMHSTCGIAPTSLRAAIGPAIGPCCYEVGEELVDHFAARGWDRATLARWFSRRDGRLYLDVWQANADELERAGIPRPHVHVSRLCTACHPSWFCSYRRDGAGTGRLAGFIRPRPPRS